MKYIFTLFIIILLSFSCSKKSQFLDSSQIEMVENPENSHPPCNQWKNYVPDTSKLYKTPMRYLKVNFHIMQRADGSGNFDEEAAINYVNMLLWISNLTLESKNQKMNLPVGNNTEVLPPRYQYVLTPDPSIPNDDGIYFHQDEELYFMVSRGRDKDIFKKDVIHKYAIQKDEVINIFFMAHHADSLKAESYHGTDIGVALGTSVKLLGLKTNYDKPIDDTNTVFYREWFMQGLLNHEIGHVLGLSHSWIKHDRCPDTPPHTNCWNYSAPPCNHVSNNVMDYNVYRSAWSPCQIGIVHNNLSNKDSRQRKLLVKNWCDLDPNKTVKIRTDEIWDSSVDLFGNLIVENDATLTINCRVSIPKGGKIIIKPRGKLILGKTCLLENDCDDEWEGILLQASSKEKGKVISYGTPIFKNMKHSIQK